MKWLRTVWETFTYTNGKFSRSGVLRTIFNFQLIFIYHFAAVASIPQYGITWEFILLTAICAAVFLSDYRILDKLSALKPQKQGSYWGYDRSEPYLGERPGGSRKTEDLEGL